MKSSKLLPLSGILGVVLVVGSFVVPGSTPDADASAAEAASFYADNTGGMLASALLLALGALLILVFSTTINAAIRHAEGERGAASTLGLGGAAISATGFLILAGIGFTLGDVGDKLDPAAVQTLNALNMDLFLPAAVGTAAFLFGTGAGLIKTEILPKWLGWVAIVIAVTSITPAGFFALPLFGLWVIVSGVMLSARAEPAAA